MQSWMVRAVIAAVVSLSGLGCDDGGVPECGPGELRFVGRPPRTLFAYEESCRSDCFSQASGCEESCEAVEVAQPRGLLVGDRTLRLIDDTTLGSARALVLELGYVDESGGQAPAGWGMHAAGPATYLAGRTNGMATFVIEVGVASVASLSEADPLSPELAVSEPMESDRGTLEITSDASDDRLAGRFFLGWNVATEDPQGQVNGCFDLRLGAAREQAGALVQDLTP